MIGYHQLSEPPAIGSSLAAEIYGMKILARDIGRHNAVDRIFGKCLLEDIATDDYIVLTTGGITSEILHKVAKRGIPIIISIQAPSNLGIKLADTPGITLIASVRGKKMNIYTHGWRVA